MSRSSLLNSRIYGGLKLPLYMIVAIRLPRLHHLQRLLAVMVGGLFVLLDQWRAARSAPPISDINAPRSTGLTR